MRLKDKSIDPHGLSNELLLGLMVAQCVFMELGFDFVITSLCDGAHSDRSLHYCGNAADIRTRHLPKGQPKKMAAEIKRRLNRHYDVIFESKGPGHIHLEYQPWRRDRAA